MAIPLAAVRAFRRSVFARFGAAALALFAAGGGRADAQAISLVRQIATDTYVFERPGQYNYVPDAIVDHGVYHLYWCGSVPHQRGDFVLHAQAVRPEGPYHASDNERADTYDIALRPTGVAGNFDGEHVCDPSVIKSGATFYMFYDGAALGAHGTGTAIGLAVSSDGVHFGRSAQDAPIVSPAMTSAKPATPYGAGQPAVFIENGRFYLTFTDTTGQGANPVNGAGQFLLRSPDPGFGRNVEELTAHGWAARAPGRHAADYAWLESFSVDVATDPLSKQLLVASDQDPAATWIYLVDPTTFRPLGHAALAGAWRDGPALVKGADHALLPRPACDSLDLAVVKGDSRDADHRNNVLSWNIALARGTIHLGGLACSR